MLLYRYRQTKTNYRSNTGYSKKIKVVLRGRPEYLEAIHRSLLQQEIDSTIKEVESKMQTEANTVY